MYEEKRIAVVVPCHNEEKLVTEVIRTMPEFVDRIYVVDDRSTDRTADVVREYVRERDLEQYVTLIQHEVNQGVGGAIITGYLRAAEDLMDVVAVMAGDAQMDPADLDSLVELVARGEVAYAKGNRLSEGKAWDMVPHVRYLGNAVLSLMTKVASGYWHIFDSQTGYTAISREAIQALDWDSIWKGYGYPNDLLIKLSIKNFRVRDVPVRPVYGVGEVSGIRLSKVIPIISLLLFKGFIKRLFFKFVVQDTHPLILFYLFGSVLFFLGFAAGTFLILYRLLFSPVAPTTALLAVFATLFGMNFLMFALWFDMDYHKNLR